MIVFQLRPESGAKTVAMLINQSNQQKATQQAINIPVQQTVNDVIRQYHTVALPPDVNISDVVHQISASRAQSHSSSNAVQVGAVNYPLVIPTSGTSMLANIVYRSQSQSGVTTMHTLAAPPTSQVSVTPSTTTPVQCILPSLTLEGGSTGKLDNLLQMVINANGTGYQLVATPQTPGTPIALATVTQPSPIAMPSHPRLTLRQGVSQKLAVKLPNATQSHTIGINQEPQSIPVQAQLSSPVHTHSITGLSNYEYHHHLFIIFQGWTSPITFIIQVLLRLDG